MSFSFVFVSFTVSILGLKGIYANVIIKTGVYCGRRDILIELGHLVQLILANAKYEINIININRIYEKSYDSSSVNSGISGCLCVGIHSNMS